MSARGRVGLAAAAAVVAVLAMVLLAAVMAPTPAAVAQSSAGCYRQAGGNKWVCRSGGEMEFQSGSTLDVQSGATFSVGGNAALNTFTASGNSNVDGTLAVGGALALESDVNLVPQTPITVTNAGTFTVGGGVQLIQAAGAVTPVLNSGSQGQKVTLLNISNQNITIADTTGQLLSAAAVLGQWDTLTLYYYGTNWIEVARSNN